MQTNLMRDIHKGMKVFDRDDHEIGTVEWVKFGDDDPSTPQVEAVTSSEPQRRDSIIDNIAEAFSPDEIPEALRARLMQQGFVRVDSNGLFAHDRYVLPEQIMGISSDRVTLKVGKDELIKHE
jgi:hypothetical protein